MADQTDAREAALKFIEDENLRYQAVPLPGGVVTPGHERGYLIDSLFGDDFVGKSFCDIGSYLGYFCIEALRRGASGATGIETDATNIRHANRIAELWSMEPDYIHGNIEVWEPGERKFDVVSCLNVLHHLYDPIHALHKMMKMTRSRLVLEICTPTWRDVFHTSFLPARRFRLGAPAIFMRKPRKHLEDAARRTYMFTPQSLKVILNGHTTMFEPIKISGSPFKDRIVVTAQKRRIGHLVVVAGPTSVGKSTLASRLREDAAFRGQFGMESGEWPIYGAKQVSEMPGGRRERLILHYDFLRPPRSGIRSYDRDPVLHLFDVAEKVTIVTIAASRARIRDQLQRGEIENRRRPAKRNLDRAESYARPGFLGDLYSAWEGFCAGFPQARQVLVENRGDFRIATGEHWKDIVEA